MLDLKFVRDNLPVVEQALKNRNASVDLTEFIGMERNVGNYWSKWKR